MKRFSAYVGVSLMVLLSLGLSAQPIVQVEYFIDADPGFGSAAQVPFTQDSIITLDLNIPLSGLTIGSHTLFVRVKDSLGNWSFTQKQSFLYQPMALEPDVTMVEYYFDTDPGQGSGNMLPLTPGVDIEINTGIDIDTLAPGSHTLFARAKDENGLWSYVQKRAFFHDPSNAIIDPDIIKAEIYFDNDPGQGSGIMLSLTPGVDIEINTGIDLDTLAPGSHTLFARVKDETGLWSYLQKRAFYHDPSNAIVDPDIVKVEVYFDNDPGIDSTMGLEYDISDDITVDTTVDLQDLRSGSHIFYARVKDEAGRWSFPQRQAFLFDDNRVEFAEFKFDSLPGYANWIASNPFVKDFDITADIDFDGICDLDTGWYYIEARARRELSWWSDVKVDSIEIKDFYDFAGDLKDQFGNPIIDASMHFAGVDTIFTDGLGAFGTLVPKCWGDTISAYKDSIYTSFGSYYFDNPLIDLRAKLVLGDIDTSLAGYKCQNLAGSTSDNIAYVCENATLIMTKSGEFVDTGSLSGYILHDGLNTLGTIHEISLTGEITNNGSYPRNQKLYISSIVGRPNVEIPDINHVCTDIEFPGRPVVFLDIRDTTYLQLDSVGQVAMNPADLLIAGCPTCDIDTTSMSQSIFGCSDFGVNAETFTVDDGSGNSTTCAVTVIIGDTIIPTLSCRADTLVHTDPGACTSTPLAGLFDPLTTWDNCPTSLSNDYAAGMTLNNIGFTLGDHIVKWTIYDAHGNSDSCSFIITVEDHEPPEIICPPNTTVSTDTDMCTRTVTASEFDPLSVTDNCTAFTFENDSNFTSSLNGEILELGAHMFSWTVDDQHGQTASCAFTVLVEDTQTPSIACPGNTSRSADAGQCTYTIVGNEFDPLEVSDNCFDFTYSNNANLGTTLDGIVMGLGDSTFVWMVDDQHGNTAICSVTVTVADNEAPEIICPGNDTVSTDPSACSFTIVGTQFDPISVTDNCTAFTFQNDSNFTTSLNGEIVELGMNIYTWTVDDHHGQTASCVFSLVVEDNQLPVITCPGSVTRNTDLGQCIYSIVGNEFDPLTVGDNCVDFTYSNDANEGITAAGIELELGDSTFVWIVDDQHGNTAICSLTVTVEDVEAPQIMCPANTTISTDADGCTLTVANGQFDPVSVTDNCTAFTFENDSNFTSSLNGEILELGAHLFTWTVDDQHGQTAQCAFTVQVEDQQTPVITCPGSATRNTDPGQCTYTIVSGEFDPLMASDNCLDFIYTNDAIGGTTLDGIELGLGDSTFVWTIDDQHGNTAVCSLTVTVEDNEDPTISCQDSTTRNTDSDECSYIVIGSEFAPFSVADNCIDFTYSNSINNSDTLAGVILPRGMNQVLWTLDDGHGQFATCTQIITVIDTQPPQITCAPDVTLEIGAGICDTLYTYNVESSDNCSGLILSMTNGIGSGGQFPIGATNEGYTVTDIEGNTAVCNFTVTVDQLPRNLNDTICYGDSIFLAGAWQYLPGLYIDTFANVNGCDSVVEVILDTTTFCIWPSEYVYVDSSAIGGNTGVDWTNAYIDLQLALDVARRYFNIKEVWVAKGTYYPTPGTNRNATYQMVDSLSIYGGFSGSESLLSERNFELNPTILSGNIGNPTDSLDNSKHILSSSNQISITVVDGFSIRDGYTDAGSDINRSGSGLINRGKAVLANMTFENCASVNHGSAIANKGNQADLTLINCFFFKSANGAIRNVNQAKIQFVNTNAID